MPRDEPRQRIDRDGVDMKRVLVITNNLQQASYRVRIEALITPMRQRGFEWHVEVRPKSLLARRALLRTAGDYDSVLLQRKLLDPSDARLLRRHARALLFDIDDAVMFHAHEVGALSRWRTLRRFRATAHAADHVAAGNTYLADLFRDEGVEASVIPTVVDPARYAVKTHAASPITRLVWIGSRSTIAYLREILPSLRHAGRVIPSLQLLTIADETVESTADLPVEHIAWSTETEAASLLRGDVGIAPTPRDRWTLGKCGFKIIQCMAAGLPVIASPVGANAEIIIDGETGFHAETPLQWAEAIERLTRDATLRARMGAAARSRVEQRYSVTNAANMWAALLSLPPAGPSNL